MVRQAETTSGSNIMTAHIDSFHRSVAAFGAVLLTVAVVVFSTPVIPFG
jgi:ABC-type sulfate transport system permease component